MSEITRCPACTTRFKVEDEQLEAHNGLVRCGRCKEVFNAREYLHSDEPSPQLSFPIEELTEEVTELAEASVSNDTAAEEPVAEASTPAADDAQVQDETETEQETEAGPDLTPIRDLDGLEDTPTTLAQQVQFVDSPPEEIKPRKKFPRAALAASLLLALLLAAQGSYYYRDGLAVRLPGLKPVLTEYCALLDCSIELPRDADALAIESSELESDSQQANVITLHALLHNRSRFSQAWPSLELTLTGLQDEVLARRRFHPADYLHAPQDAGQGLAANREREIALRLDTSDLRPSGYRLLLFYPQ